MNWQQIQLRYVTRFAYGDALPSVEEEREGSIKVYGSNGPFARFSKANTQSPAIIIGRKGSYGKINWSPEACYASDTTFFIDETTTKHHLRWLFYVLQTLRLDEGSNETAVPGLNRDHAYRQKLFIPPLPEQRAIAAYLDRETARLDTLTAALERLLDMLAENRQALIAEVISGRRSVASNGVNWQQMQLKYVARLAYGDSLPSTDEEREGPIKVYGSNGSFAKFSRANTRGDAIILGRKGSYGKVNWSSEPCFASDTTFFIDNTTTQHHLRWFFYVLQTLKLDEGSNETAVPGLNRDHAYRQIILVPPSAEQRTIATYLDQEIGKFDILRAALEQLRDLLTERRQTLIAEVVSGKRPVASSGAASPGGDPAPDSERLVAELDALDVPFLQGAARAASGRMPPGALLAALAASDEARLRLALVPLLLRRPDFAAHVRVALNGAEVDTTAQLVLKCYYTAARYLQQKYRPRLEKVVGHAAALPDLFSAELELPAAPDPDAGLQGLARRHAALSGKTINWVGTYEHAAQRWLTYMERRQAWTR